MTRLVPAGLLFLALAVARAEQTEGELIVHATAAKVGAWEIHGGGLRLAPKQPGVAFATTRKPGGKREVAFVVLFAHAYTLSSKASTSEEISDDDSGKLGVKQSLDIDGKKFSYAYNLRFDPKVDRVLAETATVAGKAIDLRKGRVVVLDMTARPVRWVQLEDKLPADVGDATEEAEVRKVALGLSGRLLKRDEVKKFLGKP